MGTGYFRIFVLLAAAGLLVFSGALAGPRVELKSDPSGDLVEIWIDGEHFTSYRYGEEFTRKPVFYPVMSPDGVMVNRELPQVRPEVSAEQDHPHHESLFMGYGDVDGYDFWSNRNGERILHRAIVNQENGEEGLLEILLDWCDPDGEVLVREIRRVAFGGSDGCLWMDHDITLNAGSHSRVFMDTKEGMFAIRLADELREEGGNGSYINAYGWESAANVWGKRCPWVALRGSVAGNDVTVAIFDHPSTENFPSYWHARDYGLFSVNPFGRKDFVRDAAPLAKKLEAYESFHFRYRLLVYSGKVSKDRLDRDYWDWTK